jgi:hypothetical protein
MRGSRREMSLGTRAVAAETELTVDDSGVVGEC